MSTLADPALRKQLAAIFVLTSLVMLGAISNSAKAQGTCGIQYKVESRGASYPGSTVTIVNNFTNSGSLAMQVTSITVTVDFGTFSAPSSSLPLSIPVGSTNQELDFDMQVPSSASMGSHSASASAAFQCNESGSWVTPSFSPLVLSTTFVVGQNPGTSALIGLAILGALVALAVAVVVLVIKRRKKPAAPMPPPAYMPPPPPPTQTPPGQ